MGGEPRGGAGVLHLGPSANWKAWVLVGALQLKADQHGFLFRQTECSVDVQGCGVRPWLTKETSSSTLLKPGGKVPWHGACMLQ